MGKTVTSLTMSLDGFIAAPDGDISRLFGWYYSGDTDFPIGDDGMVFKLSRASAAILRERFDTTGAIVTGRNDFEVSRAWGGKSPLPAPIFILTHSVPQEWSGPDSPFTFVTDGIESAIAQARAVAGDKDIAVSSSTTMQQALKAGLLDEIHIDLAPILLGEGVRLFDHLGGEPIDLEKIEVIDTPAVTHLKYRVVK